MLSTIKQIQEDVYLVGDKIGAPRSLLVVKDKSSEDGSPHVEIKTSGFDYVCSERGVEIYRRSTESYQELLYWIVSGVAFQLASKFELANRVGGLDSRRLIFSKYISMLGGVSCSWGEKASNEIAGILETAPYSDG